MAYAPHDKFVMGGLLTGGPATEIWACSINGTLLKSGTIVQADYDAWLTDVAAGLMTWYAASTSRMRSDSTLTYAKLNAIGPDGKYAHPTTPHTKLLTSTAGGVGPVLPDFVTLAWSWKDTSHVGPASNGRIYPPNSLATYATGSTTVTSGELTAQVTAAKNLLNAISQTYTGGLEFVPGLFSSKGAATGAILQIRVGNVLDVQRRRKNKFPETYSTTTYP